MPRSVRSARPGISGSILDAVEHWSYLAFGVASVARDFSAEHASSTANEPTSDQPATVWTLLPKAASGATMVAMETVFDTVSVGEAILATMAGPFVTRGPAGIANRQLLSLLTYFGDRYDDRMQTNEQRAEMFLANVGPMTLDELLARVDIDSLLDRVDVDAALERVDVDKVIDKVDLRAIVLDTVAQVQVTDILREGTGAMASSTADAVRQQVTSASRVAGLLRRKPTDSENDVDTADTDTDID